MNRHGCECPTEGAWWPAVRTRSSTSAGTAEARKRRTSRRAEITSYKAVRVSGSKAQASGEAARSAADVGSPITGTGRGKVTGQR